MRLRKSRIPHRKVVFMAQSTSSFMSSQSPSEKFEELLTSATYQPAQNQASTENLSPQTISDDSDYADYISDTSENRLNRSEMDETQQDAGLVPPLFTSPPVLHDLLQTETSSLQDATIQECLPHLNGTDGSRKSMFELNEYGVPNLDREKHISFLHKALGKLPAPYVAADASRPWIFYWALTGLYLLGEEISQYRERLMSTVTAMQNSDGGFGGGHGQMSHCAPSYAIVLALASVGGGEALDLVNRKTLWHWLGELKQLDGGFRVCVGGEEDVRGAYCAMTMVSLLNLPIELPPAVAGKFPDGTTLITGLPEYLSRCQTYEGGIAGSPGTEAHGGYAFCALACLCILGSPCQMIPRYFNLPSLMSWLSARQYAPEGGFAGRTNKLVDGCYSHWVGGCWPLIDAALKVNTVDNSTNWIGESLYSRDGLLRYILCCCQSKKGGLRDKPSKFPDAYHSCYILAGLSAAQHKHFLETADPKSEGAATSEIYGNVLKAAYDWKWSLSITGSAQKDGEEQIFDEADRLPVLDPVFVIPYGRALEARSYFVSKSGF